MEVVSIGRAGVAVAAADDEGALIDRARAMEAAAWDALYSEHYRAIYRYAWFRVGDSAAADALAAEVFLEAVRGIGGYRYRGTSFRAWLYRIAHNLTADYLRRSFKRAAHESAEPSGTPALTDVDFAPALLARRDLHEAVARLTDDQQQIVILRFFEGLSLAEVSAATGRREGAIKSLQHRAIGRLRALLAEVD
jgi:RNA polymerase sigma-70 factor (ECF subfamily)